MSRSHKFVVCAPRAQGKTSLMLQQLGQAVNAALVLRDAIERPDPRIRLKALLVPVDALERFDMEMLSLGIKRAERKEKF